MINYYILNVHFISKFCYFIKCVTFAVVLKKILFELNILCLIKFTLYTSSVWYSKGERAKENRIGR